MVRVYDIRKEAGSRLTVGSCPHAPCFRMELRKLNLESDPPTMRLSVGGVWDQTALQGFRGFGLEVPIRPGCSTGLGTRHYDLRFEVISDRLEFLRAWVAILEGTREDSGTEVLGPSCPPA